MKLIQTIWKIIVNGFAIASLATLTMFMFVTAGSSLDSIRVGQFLLIVGFSLIISASLKFFSLRKMHIMVRILLQYLTILISFMILFLASGNIQSRASTILIFTFLLTALYAMICGISFPILKATGYYEKHLSYSQQDSTEGKKPYQSRFS